MWKWLENRSAATEAAVGMGGFLLCLCTWALPPNSRASALPDGKTSEVEVVDSLGRPVEKATVYLFTRENPLFLGQSASRTKAKKFTTDEHGCVLLSEVSSPDHAGLYVTKAGTGGVLHTSLDFSTTMSKLIMQPFGSLTGAVYNIDEPEVDKDVTLTKDYARELTVNYTTQTDKAGRFQFDKIPAGTYTLATVSRFDNMKTMERRSNVSIASGANPPVLIGGSGGTRVTGKITTEDGKPLAGALVRMYSSDGLSFETSTDTNGDYSIVEVPDGQVLLSATVSSPGQGRYSGSEYVDVPEDPAFEKNLGLKMRETLAPGVTLAGVQGKVGYSTITLASAKQPRVILLPPMNPALPSTKDKLTTLTRIFDKLTSVGIDVIAISFAGQHDEELAKLKRLHPKITFLYPDENWIAGFLKRHPTYNRELGILVNRNGKVLEIIRDEADLMKLLQGVDK